MVTNDIEKLQYSTEHEIRMEVVGPCIINHHHYRAVMSTVHLTRTITAHEKKPLTVCVIDKTVLSNCQHK